MGGHGHDHHHEPYKVPKAEEYNKVSIDKIYELKILKDALAKKGLKDPWIRNEVWRYNQKAWGNPRLRIFKFLFVGFPLGAACAAATIAFEEYFGVYKHEHDHAHGSASHH